MAETSAFRREWYVLHVRPRTEKKVALFLESAHCFHYLPLLVKVTKVQRRKVRRELPLFPGYVFTRLNPDERREILKTNLLVQTLPVRRPREMIHQLRQIRKASRGTENLKVVNPFKVGDMVRVKFGPFRGLEGRLKREGTSSTIVLNLEILGQAVETAISPADCELVN